ncbi:MAG: histidine phosphotransferase family protein [Pseudomonadota bacterium]|nr:histidine phosphotransferase family protein [Pseudomonadota bacterium]
MIKPKLHELVASRICHDLISPIGACANGVELMAMGGGGDEIALIKESAEDAVSRVRFFRFAFGLSDGQQAVSASELRTAMKAIASKKIAVVWEDASDVSRKDAQALCLALLCLERAMPRGGDVTIKHLDSNWTVTAETDHLLVTDALWTPLADGRAPEEVLPATVSFALLPVALRQIGRRMCIRLTESRILMQF